MYVIFPADEVVYLSYGRLIVVPNNSNPDNLNNPIRTNSYNINTNNTPSTSSSSCATLKDNCHQEEAATIDKKNRASTSSTQEVEPPPSASEVKPKKKGLLRLNFNLLRRGSKSSNNKSATQSPALTARVRHSIGHKEHSGILPPSEAFKDFCRISGPVASGSLSQNCKEKTPSELGILSKRSSSSSKPSLLVQDDQLSKRSSKQSSSSSKSTKIEKKSPSPLSNSSSGDFRRSQSQIQRDSAPKTPIRKISNPTNLTAEGFYPLSTSREKNLVEPSPLSVKKEQSNSFRLSFKRSKTPEPSQCHQPSRPERKKDKKPTPIRNKPPERKLSFSDYLTVNRENRTAVLVPLSDGEKARGSREKSPVLSLFRKTPSPKNLGRDRTPHLNKNLQEDDLKASDKKNDIGRAKGTVRRKERVQ